MSSLKIDYLNFKDYSQIKISKTYSRRPELSKLDDKGDNFHTSGVNSPLRCILKIKRMLICGVSLRHENKFACVLLLCFF